MTGTNTYGKLYLIPTPLGGDEPQRCVPTFNIDILCNIRHFVVEELRTARRFLRQVIPAFPIDDCDFQLLNEHTTHINSLEMLAPAFVGNDMALLSEAGLPCVADPGSLLVSAAHNKGIQVIPLVGASSLMLALMASGLSGQHFCFHGYLPTDKQQLTVKIRNMEMQSGKNNQSQIFMEAPYRNNQLLQHLLEVCKPSTYLCIACNITLLGEYIATKSIKDWRNSPLPQLHKQNTVFILQHNP